MPDRTRISIAPGRAGRVLGIAAPVTLAFLLLATLAGTAASAALPRSSAPSSGIVAEPTATPSPTPTPTPTPTPIVIQPEGGLFSQFGYAPPFTRNLPTFDSADQPYIRSRSGDPDYTGFVQTLRDGVWKRLDMLRALRAAYPDFTGTQGASGGSTAQIVFDTQDRAYTLVTIRLEGGTLRNVMLWSTDGCATWRVTELPAGDVVSEIWVGHNTIEGPPLLLVCRVDPVVNPDTGKLRRTLYLSQPSFSGDGIVVPALTQISAGALGLSDGATTASTVVSHGDLSWIVWANSTPRPSRGSPVYVTTYDRRTQTLGPRVLLARSLLGNDGHAQPGIVIDSQGYLHVIAGAHGHPFQYRQSLVPFTAYQGWSQLEEVGSTGYAKRSGAPVEEGRMTYLAFVCDQQDRLHIAYRQWRRNTDPWFGGAVYGALSYQRHDPELGWTSPRPLVVPPYSGYSIYAQALGLDHRGRLYLSASCTAGSEGSARKAALERWRQTGSEGPQPPAHLRRMVLVSVDGGEDWRFATTADLTPGAPE
jgi:hypothetical protein